MLAGCVSRGGRQRLPSLPQFGQNVHPAISKSIGLVDDEKSYADLLTKMLEENLTCPVHSFTRPLEALKALPPTAPGVYRDGLSHASNRRLGGSFDRLPYSCPMPHSS